MSLSTLTPSSPLAAPSHHLQLISKARHQIIQRPPRAMGTVASQVALSHPTNLTLQGLGRGAVWEGRWAKTSSSFSC